MSNTKRESTGTILAVAVLVSLVCSIFVASAAVLLKPRQEANARLYMQRNILEVAGLLEPGADVDELFAAVETRIVDLESGAFVDDINAAQFDALKAATDPELGVAIPVELDLANIGRRARYATVYFSEGDGADKTLILPIRGYGLWSTMYGLIAMDTDGVTVRGISFYEHAETPGLGDQIEDPQWRASWRGKKIFDDAGALRFEVVKGRVPPGDPLAVHRVDGLSGATLTGNGVSNLVRYWLGEHGYGPFLEQLRNRGHES